MHRHILITSALLLGFTTVPASAQRPEGKRTVAAAGTEETP